jgi:CBS domain-containing protein
MSVKRLLKSKGSFVPVIPSDVTLNEVIDQLETDEAGALVVTDDSQEILGIITERDIARGLSTYGRDLVERPVRELMTERVITADINEPLTTVLELMDEYRIHYIPITDGGSLCGIINMLDLVKYRLTEIESEANALKAYVSGDGYS